MTVARKTLLLCMTTGLLAACQTAPQQRSMTGEALYTPSVASDGHAGQHRSGAER